MRYSINCEDRLETVSSAWLEFARLNGASGLTRDAVIGKSLWNFVEGAEIRHFFELVFIRVRTNGISVVLPFRCDSPIIRRHMELSVRPGDLGSIELDGRLIRSTPREPVLVLDPTVERNRRFLTICSWCKQVRLPDERWVEAEEAAVTLRLFSNQTFPQLTHGMCPACAESVRRELETAGAGITSSSS